jgi:hypothetical protein
MRQQEAFQGNENNVDFFATARLVATGNIRGNKKLSEVTDPILTFSPCYATTKSYRELTNPRAATGATSRGNGSNFDFSPRLEAAGKRPRHKKLTEVTDLVMTFCSLNCTPRGSMKQEWQQGQQKTNKARGYRKLSEVTIQF